MSGSDLAYVMVDPASMEMAGQVVVITHASTAMGLAVAREVQRRGGEPFLHCRSPEALSGAASMLGGLPHHACQPWEADAHREILARALEAYGRVDAVVNIVDCDGDASASNADRIDVLLGETIRFSALLCAASIELLTVQGVPGAIVNLARANGGDDDMSHVVRLAMAGVAETAARSAAPAGVRVNHVDYCERPEMRDAGTGHSAIIEQVLFWASPRSRPISGQRCNLSAT